MTSILVTGRGGQVGGALADLADDPRFGDVTIIATDRSTLDLGDPASITDAIDELSPDIVINTAAFTAVDAAEADETTATAVNADGVRTLAEACAARSARLIQLSTDYVFDGSKDGWYVESDPVAPLGAYGRSKAAGEEAARVCDDHLILRTAWVYAAAGQNFVKTMLRVGAERNELRVVDDQVGCPTSAGDIAEVLLRLAELDLTGTYHLAGAEALSWHAFATAIFEEAGFPVTVLPIGTVEYPTPAPRPANSRLDSTALADATGIQLPGWTTSLPGVVSAILDTDS